MTTSVVVVLTYRRPPQLAALLPVVLAQAAPHGARVLVVDNDPDASARHVALAAGVEHVHEPRPGIAAARNRALDEAADEDLLVFVDDDEQPVAGWLDALLDAHAREGGAGVVGPVVSEFEVEPSAWLAAGDFFVRRRLPTGTPVDVAATNNLLLDLREVRRLGLRFDERFGLSGGSDTLFTRELVRGGGRLVWCDEALVVDRVPPERLTARWVLRRAVRSGNSWSRTSLVLAPAARPAVRAGLAARGALRLTGGLLRHVWGRARGDQRHAVRGLRTAARGLGMLGGCLGHVQVEYARPGAP